MRESPENGSIRKTVVSYGTSRCCFWEFQVMPNVTACHSVVLLDRFLWLQYVEADIQGIIKHLKLRLWKNLYC